MSYRIGEDSTGNHVKEECACWKVTSVMCSAKYTFNEVFPLVLALYNECVIQILAVYLVLFELTFLYEKKIITIIVTKLLCWRTRRYSHTDCRLATMTYKRIDCSMTYNKQGLFLICDCISSGNNAAVDVVLGSLVCEKYVKGRLPGNNFAENG